jgi:hypothetical protein
MQRSLIRGFDVCHASQIDSQIAQRIAANIAKLPRNGLDP